MNMKMRIKKNSIILKSKEKPIRKYWLFVFGLTKVEQNK